VPGGVQVQQFPALTPWPALPADATAEKGRLQPRLDGAGSEYPLAYSACQALTENLAAGRPYAAGALFLLNANPVHDLPGGGRFAGLLRNVPLVVSFSPILDESAAHADLILPALSFLEVWQDDILEATGYPGIALRQPVVQPVRNGRNPGDVLLQLARLVGGPVAQAMPWLDFLQVVKDRVAGMDISWEDLVEKGAWSALVYRYAAPGSRAWNQVVGRDRVAAPRDGRYDLFSREAFAALSQNGSTDDLSCLPHFELPAETATSEYPFLLISQETMTQTRAWSGILPSLAEVYGLQVESRWESWAEIHPKAARALGIADGEMLWLESATGRVRLRARLVEGIWPNAVNAPAGLGLFSPVQWGREAGTAGQTVGTNAGAIASAGTERASGLAAAYPTRVRVYRA
jgi:anaerobic selenocysteine-containing dehydrogenase